MNMPSRELLARLDADLLAVRRLRSTPQIAAIRALKAALANAEAMPVEERPYELVEGSADVPRRELDTADMTAIIEAEVAERERAIDLYRALGADTVSLELELETLQRYRELV